MDNLKNFDCRAGFKHKNQNEKQQNEKFSAIQQSEVLMSYSSTYSTYVLSGYFL